MIMRLFGLLILQILLTLLLTISGIIAGFDMIKSIIYADSISFAVISSTIIIILTIDLMKGSIKL